jgi:hypothetical protein
MGGEASECCLAEARSPKGEGGSALRSIAASARQHPAENIENNPMHSSGMIEASFSRIHFGSSGKSTA